MTENQNSDQTGDWKSMPDGMVKRLAYYCSREWTMRRLEVKQRSGGDCERCKKSKANHCHHLTYANLYNEPMTDLLDVCEGCHNWIHGKSKDDPVEYWKKANDDTKSYAAVCDGYVQCPSCKGVQDYVHILGIEVLQGEVAANVTRENVEIVKTDLPVNRRGSVVMIKYWCECGCVFDWKLQFHKGMTMFEVATHKNNPSGYGLGELWRD